jgi:hypothetical protein
LERAIQDCASQPVSLIYLALFRACGSRYSHVVCSAVAVGQAKTEILPFRFMEVIVGIVVEVFGYPELLTIFIDDSIDTLALVLCNVFCLRGHRARPLLIVGDSFISLAWNMPAVRDPANERI